MEQSKSLSPVAKLSEALRPQRNFIFSPINEENTGRSVLNGHSRESRDVGDQFSLYVHQSSSKIFSYIYIICVCTV